MGIYLIIIAVLLLLVFVYDFNPRKTSSDFWFYTICISLILLVGFRGDIGGDTMIYHRWFDEMPTEFNRIFSYSRFEPAFVAIAWLIKVLGGTWLTMQILIALSVNIAYFVLIRRFSESRFLALLLFFISNFYVLNCEELRQSLSFSILLFGYEFVKDSKWHWKYILLTLVAASFHYSSLLFILLPYLPAKILTDKLKLIVYLGVAVLAALIIQSRFSILTDTLAVLLDSSKVSEYQDSIYTEISSRSFMNYISIIFVSVVIPLINYYISPIKNIFFSKFFLMCMFCVIGGLFLVIFYRYNHLLSLFSIIVVCNALNITLKTNKNNFKKIVVFLSIGILIYVSTKSIFEYNKFLDGYFYERYVPYELYKD